ncbi:MAG: M3 family oligoendopeptidase [Lachnospiraceae bacterium]|nr:M3 family oligoendopeptidase [Lachnospiraceae bacterium]
MKVCELPYERVTIEEIREKVPAIVKAIREAGAVDEILAAREELRAIIKRFYTNASLASMRYTINTVDEFYVTENEYYDEIGPQASALLQEYYKAMLESPFRPQLEEKLGKLVFRQWEIELKSMSPAIIEDMQEENKVVMEYSKLMAGMEFEFRGEKMPRTLLMKYAKDDDRATRKECYEALGKGLQAHAAELDDIFDRLVHIRDRMARKMGYKNFVELGYYRMGRLSYDQDTIAVLRENILKDIVPVVARLRLENAKRLGIDGDYMLYDNDVVIPGGDPKPFGKAEIFAAAKEMYHAMGPETGAFIDLMMDNEAFDVDSRQNKWGGGYCTEFELYKQPFILANFNGTAADVDVMTHEAGHALNAYFCFDNEPFELGMGMETAETHSMSMEFFSWPYMGKFFGDKERDYRFMHALDSLTFLPYGTIVDYFQHIVYENPDMTPAERKEAWNKLEAEFRPWISTKGMPYLEEGTRWQYQMHIYESPFYYIDYVLAQTAAFAFLLASQEDYEGAFKRYIALSKKGGTELWPDLLKEAGLPSPFEPGALKEMAEKVEKLLKTLA